MIEHPVDVFCLQDVSKWAHSTGLHIPFLGSGISVFTQ